MSEVCAAYDEAVQVGEFTDGALTEASGLVASALNDGIYWVVADSGNPAWLFAVSEDGILQATYQVAGAENIDWEDLASGPGPDGCASLYIGDIGFPGQEREGGVIYRVSEPILGSADTTATATALPFVFPDGMHDAETLLVDPNSGAVYVVTRDDDGLNAVYRLPSNEPTGEVQLVLKVGEIVFDGDSKSDRRATGGAVSLDGTRLVVRTETQALELPIPPGGTIEDALAGEGVVFALPSQSQGEGIAYSVDGTRLLVDSEDVPSPLFSLTCQAGAASTPLPALARVCEDAGEPGDVYGCGCEGGSGDSSPTAALVWLVLAGLGFKRRPQGPAPAPRTPSRCGGGPGPSPARTTPTPPSPG